MNTTFRKSLLAPAAALVLASLATATMDSAFARGGGGGGGGGGRGGGGAQSVQPASRADVRTNDVRSTSVNNVNVNRNVHVDVDPPNGGWDHPVAAAAVVVGAIGVTAGAIGSTVAVMPVGCVPVDYGGMVYYQCGDTWYVAQGSQYVPVNPPY